MIRLRANSILACAAIFWLATASFAAGDSNSASGGDSDIIPTSAVSSSDNCSRIATLEEQFEGGVTPWNLQHIQGPEQGPPLGVSGKFRLAVANFSDPFNILSIAFDAEVGNATGPKSPLPRGALGFGDRFGQAMAGEALGEFSSTFLVSSIFHQDPHYHRLPDAPSSHRLIHALSYVVVTRSDSGRPMFNYAEFLGTASSSIVEGSFHPEWERGPGASAGRIFISIGSDAAWNLLTEFLPDVARHVNPRLMLLRRLADRAAAQN